jgi:hypothetical protein
MKPNSDLPFKQLMVPPFRKETDVSKEELPIYSTINPIIPPFLPYRSVSNFPNYPSIQQQTELLKHIKQRK